MSEFKKESIEEVAERFNPIIIRSTPFGSKYEFVPKKERKQFINDYNYSQQQINCELSELKEQRDEMLAMLENLSKHIDLRSYYNDVVQLIKKVKNNN